jgi:hypothetical protein
MTAPVVVAGEALYDLVADAGGTLHGHLGGVGGSAPLQATSVA